MLVGNIPQHSLFTMLEPLPGPADLLPEEDEPLLNAPFMNIISKLSMIPGLKKTVPVLAVVIENHEAARPHQQGLDEALLIQEHIVEGLISRFVVFFDSRKLPKVFGPVRSLRRYFIDAFLPYTNVVIHAGGSPDALERAQAGDITAINGLYYDNSNDTDAFIRIDGIAAPHDLFTGRAHIKGLLPETIDPVKWPPYETGKAQSETDATAIRINFFNPTHNVHYRYLPDVRRYERTNGDTVSEAQPRNVLVLEVPILGEREFGRLDINMQGAGKLALFQSGRVIEGRWSKQTPESNYEFTTLDGDTLKFASGQTWMTVVPSISRVSWE